MDPSLGECLSQQPQVSLGYQGISAMHSGMHGSIATALIVGMM